VDDIDKRLSRFLHDIKLAYNGVYSAIYSQIDHHIIAASDAALIGRAPGLPSNGWVMQLQGDTIGFELEEGPQRPSALGLHAQIKDAFSTQSVGTLHANFDWTVITTLLNRAVAHTQRHALLINAEGRILATSDRFPADSLTIPRKMQAITAQGSQHGIYLRARNSQQRDELLIGYAHLRSYRMLPDFGWWLLILIPKDLAFAPIKHLLWQLLGLLTVIVLIAILLAITVSGRIAHPIQQLTRYTRKVGEDLDLTPENINGSVEVNELNQAFDRMISDLRQSRAHLIRVSKLAAVGEVAAMLAHELRTPLGIMRSSSQLLARQQCVDERGREMLDFMLHECDRINDLVGNLLECAGPRALVFGHHDIDKLITHVIELVHSEAKKKSIEIAFRSPRQVGKINCDRDQMIQVLLNLLMNAIQIVDENGHILVSITADDEYLKIAIEDDGPGIASDQRQRILEPFVSQRSGGVGLGLPIVQEILQLHQAGLEIGDSQLGGALFLISMPLQRRNSDA
jgi:two-component system sensor histidine kinase HydH